VTAVSQRGAIGAGRRFGVLEKVMIELSVGFVGYGVVWGRLIRTPPRAVSPERQAIDSRPDSPTARPAAHARDRREDAGDPRRDPRPEG
jgi:hypothetical protein